MSAVLEVREPSARYLAAFQPSLLRQFDLAAGTSGGVPRLRELILTLAAQGKLVSQNAADEPATVLLQKIGEEHRRLIANGLVKRERTVSPIDESNVPFALPTGWVWARLGTALPFRIGKTPPSKDSRYWSDSGFNWVSISDMTHFGEITDTGRKLTQLGADFFGHEPLPPGTLLMSFKLTIGKIAVLRVPAYHNEAIASFVSLGGTNSEFLKYVLPSVSQTGSAKDALMGQTLNAESISDLLLALPPIAEQARIVARVDELMRLCDALEAKGRLEAEQHTRLVNTLLGTLTDSATPEELAANWQRVAEHFDLLLDRPEAVDALEQTVLQLAARGLLVPQDPDDEPTSASLIQVSASEPLFNAPPSWAWVQIDQIATVQGGIQKTPLRRPVKHHVPYLRVANVQRDALDLREIERFEVTPDEVERWNLRAGDLLIVEGNGSEHEIGRSAVWDAGITPCVYQNHLIRVRCNEPAATSFLQLFLNSPDGKAEMKRLAITTSGLYNLSVGKIRRFVVPLPPLAEQARIVAHVTTLRRLCTDLRHRLQAQQTTQSRLAEALVEQATA